MHQTQPVDDERGPEGAGQRAWLEWLASGVGLLLATVVFGFIGWQALNSETTPPVINVRVERTSPVEGGYLVEFRAYNESSSAAAQVEIEGTLGGGDEQSSTSRASFDYIPGRSSRQGGLFFNRDPRSSELRLRALGFSVP
jgi:uncharacterized protein (TIGR02588 family)